MSAGDVLPVLLVVCRGLLTVVGLACLLSGIDDCFIDLCFAAMACRGLTALRIASEQELLGAAEQPIAVMVPAWDESAVIGRMVGNFLKSVTYSNYHVFVGTYPNDPATHREVDAVTKSFANVHRVVCPNNGPTASRTA